MRVKVAFLWHMHQPSYRDPIDGTVVLPWVRLHALKDYLGMLAVAEAAGARVTFNLVPSLLDQVEAFALGRADEPLLHISNKPAGALNEAERLMALRGLFMAHEQNLIGRFPRFAELAALRGPKGDDASIRAALGRFSVQDLRDLQLISKLAWFDRGWQEADATVRALIDKGRGFTEEDQRALAERETALLSAIIPAYRRAAEAGRIELSTSPYYHPILPLLCDTEAHKEAQPGAPLPRRYRHPEDAADQIQRAIARHTALFGAPPAGLWPSEGSVSEEAVLVMARCGIRWAASDEGVLERSLRKALHRDMHGTAHPLEVLYGPWLRRTAAGDVGMIFRDRTLSDLIGFSYAPMEPEAAAADFLQRLRRIGEAWRAGHLMGDPVVPVILDGENAWEYFRDGGRVFLRRVYEGIAEDPGLEAVSMNEVVPQATRELPRVFAGSWIHADFSVWIGHADDRRAWDLLGEARDALVAAEKRLAPEARERAWEAFRAACGSDWCWWYGTEHHSDNDLEFDRLFRRHLQAIYEAAGLHVPEALAHTLITARRVEVKMSRPAGRIAPVLDGRITTPDEWARAGVHRVAIAATTMRRGPAALQAVLFGRGDERLHVLLETSQPAREALAQAEAAVSFPGTTHVRYRVSLRDGRPLIRREQKSGTTWVDAPTGAEAAVDAYVEASIPVVELPSGPGGTLAFRILMLQGDVELERHPEAAPIEMSLE